jgi:hypothetical protein
MMEQPGKFMQTLVPKVFKDLKDFRVLKEDYYTGN